MKPFYKRLLIIFGIDTTAFLISYVITTSIGEAGWLSLIAWLIGILVQMLVGIIFTFTERTRVTGQALMLAGLLTLLVGFSVCSEFWK